MRPLIEAKLLDRPLVVNCGAAHKPLPLTKTFAIVIIAWMFILLISPFLISYLT